MDDIEKWVRKLYSLGYTPIPIRANSKAPNGFEPGELKYYHYHRPDKEIIDTWLEYGLYENIALMLGEAHGNLVCFDFDNPAAYEELELDEQEMINNGTWIAETPTEKGRYHIYVENISDEFYTRETSHGVELRANEHYVLFYPSVHPNGHKYNLLNTHKPDKLEKTRAIKVKKLWTNWKKAFDNAFANEESIDNHIKKRKEFDRSPDCIRNAWELGSPVGERQFTIIGLSNWMRENSFPREMAKDVIANWFKTKCNRRGKPMKEVYEAVDAGYDDKYTYGCRFWRNNTSFCPFKEKTDCKWYQPDVKSKHEVMEQYGAITYNDNGTVSVNAPNVARMIMEEHDYNFVTIVDESKGEEHIYYYEDGYYKRRGRAKIRQLVNYYLEDKTSEYYKREIIGVIKDSKHIERDELDQNPNLINLKNGVYDLETDELLPHSPDYYFINQIPINYNPNAECPKIKDFFKDVLYPDHVPLMQELFGFTLYREYFLHVAFLLVGGGRNGKGVTVNLLRRMLGKDNYSTQSIHDIIGNRFATYNLYGKMANIGAEVADKELDKTDTFKNLTGGEPIRAEMKFGASFTFLNYAKMVFNANRVPYSHDHSFAFQQRWIVIPFPKTFPRGDPNTDPMLEKKLSTEEELEGLLIWAIKGLKRLLTRYDFSYEVGSQYEEMINPERSFIMNNIQIGYTMFLSMDEIYDKYTKWCHEHKYQVVTKKILKDKIQYYKPEGKYKQGSFSGERVYGFENLMWKPKSDKNE
jgi:putative DNA primase/helicase